MARRKLNRKRLVAHLPAFLARDARMWAARLEITLSAFVAQALHAEIARQGEKQTETEKEQEQ